MGAGGTTGEVKFPAYVEDMHGLLMANSQTDSNDGTFTGAITTPIRNVFGLMNSLWGGTNPYSTFAFTSPTTEIAAMQGQFNLYYSAVTGYTPGDYGTNIGQALLAVSQPTSGVLPELSVGLSTGALSSPETLFVGFATTLREQIALALQRARTEAGGGLAGLIKGGVTSSLANMILTSATTLWGGLLSAVTSQLASCDLPREVNVWKVLNVAAVNARDNLKSALQIAADLISSEAARNLVLQFAARRETTYQQQVGQFAATMADINAVNSSAFLFGMALLRSEQMREVADYEAQLDLQLLERGLGSYIQMHSAQLQTSASIEMGNAAAYNALLQASIALLTQLRLREEIGPNDLLALYTQLYQAELGFFAPLAARAGDNMLGLYGANIQRDQVNHGLTLDAARINKLSREQRYHIGLNQVMQMLANRVEFERMAAAVMMEQKKISIASRFDYETGNLDEIVRETLWDLEVATKGANILAAPAGMGAAIPGQPSRVSTALAAVGTGVGAALGGPGGAAAGYAVGAGVGSLF